MINLLPEEVKSDIAYAKRNVSIVQYSVLVVIIGISISAILAFGGTIIEQDKQQLQTVIDTSNNEIQALQDAQKDAAALAAKIDLSAQILEREILFSELVQEVGAVIPTKATLGGIQLTGDVGSPLLFTFNVAGNNIEDAVTVRENIAASELFDEADIQSVKPGTADETGASTFQVIDIATSFADETKNAQAAQQGQQNAANNATGGGNE